MSHENSELHPDHLPPSISWPKWSLLVWRGGGFERQVVELRPVNPERAEHLGCYLVVQLTLGETQEHAYYPLAAYGSLEGNHWRPSAEVKEEGWFPLWPQINDEEVSPATVQQAKDEFEEQLRQLVVFLNGQLLPCAWRCDWVDVILKEAHEDDGKGVYEHITRRRGYTFPTLSAAEAGYAKDGEFIIG